MKTFQGEIRYQEGWIKALDNVEEFIEMYTDNDPDLENPASLMIALRGLLTESRKNAAGMIDVIKAAEKQWEVSHVD